MQQREVVGVGNPLHTNHTLQTRIPIQHLPLPTLLLRSNHPEIAIALLLTPFLHRPLLRNLAPPTTLPTSRIMRTYALRRRSGVDKPLISELLPTNKLFGEMARVNGAGRPVDGLSQHVRVGWESDEVGGELFGCLIISKTVIQQWNVKAYPKCPYSNLAAARQQPIS
jgi:hypothetical protein